MESMSEYFRYSLNELRNSLIPDIVPLELYNHKKSRLRCSIAWLLNLVFDGKVPLEYEDPLIDEQYTDEETSKQLELNPSVAALLTSGRAYADAAQLILGSPPNLNGSLHGSILLMLHQGGFYSLSEDSSGKNSLGRLESQLAVNSPIRASVHQSVIDAFMRAYLVTHFSAEDVTITIRSIARLSPMEQPHSTEEALLLWISKVCHVVRARLEQERRERAVLLMRRSGRSTVRLDDGAPAPVIPLVKDLLADISDGAALATLICHYCPDHLRISDVALKDPLGVADSCFNLEIVRLFSDHLDKAVYFFRLEDLLYMHSSFKTNVLVFLADLFQCLSSAPPLLCSCSRPSNENQVLSSSSASKYPRAAFDDELALGAQSTNATSLLSGVEFSGDFSDEPWSARSQHGTMVVVSDNDDLIQQQMPGASKKHEDDLDSPNNDELVPSSASSSPLPAVPPLNAVASPRNSASSARNGVRPSTASSYTVSSSRQYTTVESALEAGIPVVGGSMRPDFDPLSPQSDSDQTSSVNGSVRITWAQLQRQQKRMHQPDSIEDNEVEQIVQQHSSNGLQSRSASVGSLSLKMTLERRRRAAAEQQRQQYGRTLEGPQRLGSAGRSRISDQHHHPSGSWTVRSPRAGPGDEAYATRLEQLNQSLSNLQGQLVNLSSTPKHKPTPVSGFQTQPAVMVAQPPPHSVLMSTNQQAPVIVYQTPPMPGSTTAAFYQTYQTAPTTMLAGYPQATGNFQSTQSLYVPGPTASGRPSAFTSSGQLQQRNALPEEEATTPQGQAFFVPIGTQEPSQDGAPSTFNDSSSSGSAQQRQLRELQQQLHREAELISTPSGTHRDQFSDIDESLAALANVRRSQSLSALQHHLQKNGSSTSLAQSQANEDQGSPDQQNIAFVVGEQVDADELEKRRRAKCVEMEIKRKLEAASKNKDVLSKRDVDAAKRREEVRNKQDEQEKRREAHRLKQKRVFEEYLQKKKQEEEQIELSRAGKPAQGSGTTMTKSKSRDAISLGSKSRTMTKAGRLGAVASEHENLAGMAASPPGTPGGSGGGPRSANRAGRGLASRNASQLDFDETASGDVSVTAKRQALQQPQGNLFNTFTKQAPSVLLIDRHRPRPAQLRPAKSCSSLKVNPSVPLRVQPSAKSNRTLVFNAIRDTCLAGGANAKQRQEALRELDKAPTSIRHFVILFRDAGCQYRGLYTFEPDGSVIERIHGIGPKAIKNTMIEHFFKYNSGSKRFSAIPTTQHLSVSVDAVSVYQSYWQQRHVTPTSATMSRSAHSDANTTPTKRTGDSSSKTNYVSYDKTSALANGGESSAKNNGSS